MFSDTPSITFSTVVDLLADSSVRIVLYAYATLIWFYAIMMLKQINDRGDLPKVTYYLCLPLLVLGYALDIGLNLIMSVLLLDLPREPLFTGKCERLIATGSPWRANFCAWVCKNLLDIAQIGKHCKPYQP
jgi:hypothetical protein